LREGHFSALYGMTLLRFGWAACFSCILLSAQAADPVKEPNYVEGHRLIYKLLSQEAQLSKILIVKDARPKIAEKMKVISDFAEKNYDEMTEIARLSPPVRLNKPTLPDIETRSRLATQSVTTREILAANGPEFETLIVHNQLTALRYLSTLAEAVADQEKSRPRRTFFLNLQKEAESLRTGLLKYLTVK
jgi:hypothetical protein